MPENSPYSDSDIQTALQMTANGVAVSNICEHVGCSRQTYYNWRNDGKLTDGKPWDEWLEDHHATEVLRKHNEQAVAQIQDREDFWDDQLPRLRAAIDNTVNKLANGDIPLDADGLKKVVSLVRQIENRGKELAMMQEKFMRAVFFAVREEVDKETFKLIREKVKKIRLDQLEDFDEEFAKTVLEDAE